MRKKDLEKLIISQRKNIVPSVFDSIKEKINNSNPVVLQPANKKKVHKIFSFKPVIALAAVIMLVFIALMTNNYFTSEMSIIYLDINPSLGLVIGNNYKIIDVIETDEFNLKDELKLVGKNIDDGVLSVINYAIDENLIDKELADNALSIAALEGDTKGNEIVQNLNQKMMSVFLEKEITCEIIDNSYTEDLKTEAFDIQVSPAKLNFINKILLLDDTNTLDINTLKDKSIRELYILLNELESAAKQNANSGNQNGNGFSNGNNNQEQEEVLPDSNEPPEGGLPSSDGQPDEELPSSDGQPNEELPSGGGQPNEELPSDDEQPDEELPGNNEPPEGRLPDDNGQPDEEPPEGNGQSNEWLPNSNIIEPSCKNVKGNGR